MCVMSDRSDPQDKKKRFWLSRYKEIHYIGFSENGIWLIVDTF